MRRAAKRIHRAAAVMVRIVTWARQQMALGLVPSSADFGPVHAEIQANGLLIYPRGYVKHIECTVGFAS